MMYIIIISALVVLTVKGHSHTAEANNVTWKEITEFHEITPLKAEFGSTNEVMTKTKLKHRIKKRGEDEVDDMISGGDNIANEDYYDKKYWSSEGRATEEPHSSIIKRPVPITEVYIHVTRNIKQVVRSTYRAEPKYGPFNKYDNKAFELATE